MCAGAQDLLPPYLDMLIPKLLGLLQQGQKLVQEGALTAMASVADCAKDNFVKYYDQVGVPLARRGLFSAVIAGSKCRLTLGPLLARGQGCQRQAWLGMWMCQQTQVPPKFLYFFYTVPSAITSVGTIHV